MSTTTITVVFLLLLSTSAALRLSNVFGSNMVFQRNKNISIWGWTTTIEDEIIVKMQDLFAKANVNKTTGFFNVNLPPQKASLIGRNITFTSSNTKQTITLANILFGEVILFSGQSNMEFVLPAAINATSEIATADDYPYLRFFSGTQQNVDTLISSKINKFNVTHNELKYIHLNWSISSSSVVGGCQDISGACDTCCGNPMPAMDPKGSYVSAIAFLTARKLFHLLNQTVPVGSVIQAYGGTSIQYWMSSDALSRVHGKAPPGSQCCGENGVDSCLWNTQIFPYTLAGSMKFSSILWYQGEQNANCG
jgi:sialate O-acetylesterase